MTNRAETVPVGALGARGQDRRTAAEFVAALERETRISLARDPSRWRWISSAAADHHRVKPRRPAPLAEAGPGHCRACGADLGGRRRDTLWCSTACKQRGARAARDVTAPQERRTASRRGTPDRSQP
jgi:hypothetical protein